MEHICLVDHPNEAAALDDEDAVERELREVKVDEVHGCLALDGKRSLVQAEGGQVG